MGPPPSPHERAAALLRRQQSTTARLRAGLPDLLDQLDRLEEPGLRDVEGFGMRPVDPPDDAGGSTGTGEAQPGSARLSIRTDDQDG